MQGDARLVVLGHEGAALEKEPGKVLVEGRVWVLEAEDGWEARLPRDHELLAAHDVGVVARVETKARREDLADNLRELVVQNEEGGFRRRREWKVGARKHVQLRVGNVGRGPRRERSVTDGQRAAQEVGDGPVENVHFCMLA